MTTYEQDPYFHRNSEDIQAELSAEAADKAGKWDEFIGYAEGSNPTYLIENWYE